MALKVLTVDDSKTIRAIVKKAFRPFACEIIEAENGVEGLVAANREKPDLIVLDITMPVMDGIEMLQKLKADAEMKMIPIIMLTAESGKDSVMQILKMGVKDYLIKPFKGEQLIARAEKLIRLIPQEDEALTEAKPAKLFVTNEKTLQLNLPYRVTTAVIAEITAKLPSEIKNMPKSGIYIFIFNLSKVRKVNLSLIKLIISARADCQKYNLAFRAVCDSAIKEELQQFQETIDIPIYATLDEANDDKNPF
jgi:DNA-binding response OmpR family regulator